MARRNVFTDSGFWKYSWAHLVMSMTESCRWVMQCRLRARRPRASNKGLRPCPLCTEISPVSLNLLMMLCTIDDEICQIFAIWHWGTLFLKYSTIFLRTLSQIGEPLPIFTSERLCLSKTAFTLQVLMTNSNFVTIRFFGRRAYISFKSDPYPICAFYTALGWNKPKIAYDITNQFE